ncbi:hypothetical protein GCM10007052_09710 [Halioglobus japonicus]|nr:hypothetical protein GCM10007052_09710 [Halioglobus japonicus]
MTVRTTRQCPECESGKVQIAAIRDGARCDYCHSNIEANFGCSIVAPFALAGLMMMAYRLELDYLGHFLLGLLLVYAIYHKFITSHWFPLKCYEDAW